MSSKKVFSLVFLIVAVTAVFAACSAKQVSLNIDIDSSTVQVSAKVGDSISKVLADNEIEIGENDVVEPEVDETVGESTADISVKKAKTVTVICGEEEKAVVLAEGTVKDAVEKSGFKMGKNDKLSVDENETITDGMKIEIKEGTVIYVIRGGKKEKYITTEQSVSKALVECGIKTDSDDIIDVNGNEIKNGVVITVKTVDVKEETKTETVKFSTEKKYSSSMNAGTSKVSQQGVNGQKQVTYKNTYVDGKLTKSEVVSEKTIKAPVNKIVVYGTKQTTTAAPKTTTPKTTSGKTVISKERVEDCDGSGHGYYVITYSDGSVVYQDF